MSSRSASFSKPCHLSYHSTLLFFSCLVQDSHFPRGPLQKESPTCPSFPFLRQTPDTILASGLLRTFFKGRAADAARATLTARDDQQTRRAAPDVGRWSVVVSKGGTAIQISSAGSPAPLTQPAVTVGSGGEPEHRQRGPHAPLDTASGARIPTLQWYGMQQTRARATSTSYAS